MGRPPKKPLPLAAQLNFLLCGASESDLDNFQLARLAEVANLRSHLHEVLDKLIDEMAQAAVAGWFRQTNRETLKQAILETPDARIERVTEWAKEQIRDRQRSGAELIPRTSLAPGASHLAASLRYAENNISKGLCGVCPQPLDRNSVRYCTRHLEIARLRKPPKNPKGSLPGSVDWLYSGDVFESSHGKQPGTLKALAEAREKRKRRK